MGRDFTDYKNALDVLNIPELLERINTLEKNMALKTCGNQKNNHMFPIIPEQRSQKKGKLRNTYYTQQLQRD